MTSAVLLVFFNRPDCIEQTLGAIRAARPPRLYLATDAPRPAVPGDAARCAAARATVDRLVDWPCKIRRNYSAENLGSWRRLPSAISWVFAHEERAMIFEEDCVPNPSFFPFCDELLDRYADDPRVGMISGDQFVRGGWSFPGAASYGFAQLTQIWGWAGWRRAWAHYDDAMSQWPQARRQDVLLRRIFPRYHPHRRYWRRRFDDCYASKVQAWDYRWAFARWLNGMFGIAPATNLVSYIGFRDDALHTRGSHPLATLPTRAVESPLIHPTAVRADAALDSRTARLLFYEGGYFPQLEYRLKKLWRLATD